jgi:hypothetical protein
MLAISDAYALEGAGAGQGQKTVESFLTPPRLGMFSDTVFAHCIRRLVLGVPGYFSALYRT